MSVRAVLPKVAESARLALVGAAAVLMMSTAAVQPALANSCGSMPTGAWLRRLVCQSSIGARRHASHGCVTSVAACAVAQT